jgi:uncharacterized protein
MLFQHSRLVSLALLGAVALVASAAAQSPTPKKEDHQVKPEAHLSVEQLPAGDKCRILVRLKVTPGWHIYANPAANKEDTPTVVEFTGKLGTKLTQIKYPKGDKYDPGEGLPVQSVYEGQVDIFATLEVPASASGQTEEMEILVKYQACDDSNCLRPTQVRLAGKLPVAKAGDPIKPKNAKLFANAP